MFCGVPATRLGEVLHHESVAEWTEQLQSENWLHRARAAEALGEIGTEAAAAIPALRAALHDRHVEVRRDTAEALGKIGPAAADAVPDLIVLLTS